MAKFIKWLNFISTSLLIWCYWRTKALHGIFYRRLWAQRIKYDLQLQEDMATSNSKAVALEVAAMLCKDSGLCASKSLDSRYHPISSFSAGYSKKEQDISNRLASDIKRETTND